MVPFRFSKIYEKKLRFSLKFGYSQYEVASSHFLKIVRAGYLNEVYLDGGLKQLIELHLLVSGSF